MVELQTAVRVEVDVVVVVVVVVEVPKARRKRPEPMVSGARNPGWTTYGTGGVSRTKGRDRSSMRATGSSCLLQEKVVTFCTIQKCQSRVILLGRRDKNAVEFLFLVVGESAGQETLTTTSSSSAAITVIFIHS